MEKIKKVIADNWQVIVMAVLVIALIASAVMYLNREKHYKEELEKAQVVTPKQATDENYLENAAKIPGDQTKETVKYIERAQNGSSRPAATIIVQAPTAEKAAGEVAERVNEKDPTLPTAAIEKTDRTIVTTQPENKDYGVGVYKINLRKDHKIKMGVTAVDGEAYWAAGYQNRRIEYIVNGQGQSVKGGTVMYTIAEW